MGTSPAGSWPASGLAVEMGSRSKAWGASCGSAEITFDCASPLRAARYRASGSARGVVSGLSRSVGGGEEEVYLALLQLGVQGLLIEQLGSLGFDEDPHTAVIDEGVTGRRLGHERELESLFARGDAQSGVLGGLGILDHGADGALGLVGQGKQGGSCLVRGPSEAFHSVPGRQPCQTAQHGRRRVAAAGPGCNATTKIMSRDVGAACAGYFSRLCPTGDSTDRLRAQVIPGVDGPLVDVDRRDAALGWTLAKPRRATVGDLVDAAGLHRAEQCAVARGGPH